MKQPRANRTYRFYPAVGPAITLTQGDGERVDHLALAVRSEAVALEQWSEVVPVLGRFPLRFVSG